MGSLIGSGSSFLIYIVVAREIGPKSFGIFSSALATVTIFSLAAGFGVSQSWLKLFGKEGWAGIRWVKPSLKFVVLTLILITIGLFIVAILPFQDRMTSKLLMVLIFYIYGFISVELVASKLQLEESYNYLAIWQLSPNLLRLIVVLIGLYLFKIQFDVFEIGLIYASVGLVFSFLAIPQFYKMATGTFELKGHPKIAKNQTEPTSILHIFKEAWPFGMANLFAFIYVQSDVIMVKYLSGDAEAGHYNVGYVILTAVLIIPAILFGKFLLPKYHRWSNHDIQKFYAIYKKSNVIMLVTGILAMLGILSLSQAIIPLVFGQDYQASVSLVNVLALSIPISFLAYSVGATLVTNEHMKLKVILMGLVAVFNIFCNLLLIPKYGAKGAAIATVASNFVLLILYFWGVNKKVFTTEIKKR
ncbi:MAG: flippase [Pricia sp.]|nr:flippase [Pricia sp.]